MRSWSLVAVMVALLSPLGTAQANGGGGIPVTPDSCDESVGLLDTIHLNGVLSALGHTDIDVDVDAHAALATNGVELDDLLAQVMVEVGAESLSELLGGTVQVRDVLDAMAHIAAEDGKLDVVAAIEALAVDLGEVALGEIDLGDLFSISDIDMADGVMVDMLDVAINVVSLWDQHHVVSPATITIDGDALDLDAGIASATIDVDVMYPPHIIIGPEDVSAEMGNVEVLVHADLADLNASLDDIGLPFIGAKLMLGHIDLCVFAPWVSVRADVLDDENGAAMLDAEVGRTHMCIGTPINGAIGEGNDDLDLETEIVPTLIGEIVVWLGGHEVPIAKIKARAVASAEADVTAILFNGDSACLPLDLGPTEADLWAQLFANIEITVEPLGIALSPIQITALQSAAANAVLGEISLGDALRSDLLDGIVLPSLDVLSSGLGSIDINVAGIDVAIDGGGDNGGGDNGGNDNGGHSGGDDGDGIDVDVDVNADVDVSVDDDVDVGVDTDTDVGVDVDMDDGALDGDIDADVDADIDVDADEDGAHADVDADGDVHADVGDTTADVNADAKGALNLAGGGCSVGGGPSSTTSSLAPIALLGLTLLARARRKAKRS